VAIAADRIDPGRPTKIQDVAAPNFTRTQATTDAGVSERQRKAALRLANIPEDEFEGRGERAPATVTTLAEMGTRPRTDSSPKSGLQEALVARRQNEW